MAPYLNFLIPLGFSAVGMWALFTWPGWFGFTAFIGLFLIGSFIGRSVFKRYATLDQIKADLRMRIDTD